MTGFIETITGRYAGTTFALGAGDACQVGAKFGADIFLPNDSLLAPVHFVVTSEEAFEIQDCTGKKSTFVNNEPIEKAVLSHGDYIFAGETLFRFSLEGKSSEETPLSNLIEGLYEVQSLALLVDESLDKRISSILNESKAEFRVLKESVKNLEALTSNPLLIDITDRSTLEKFIRTFWGQGSLVFIRKRFDLDETAKYLRFLLAKSQYKNGVDLRFYDPRMLRFFLSEAENYHTQYYFSGVKRYFVEAQVPSHLLEFDRKDGKISAKIHRMSDEIPKIPTQQEIGKLLAVKNLPGDFAEKTQTCLSHFLPDTETDFKYLANQNLPFIENYGIETLSAKIQFIALSAVFERNYVESSEVKKHFAFAGLAGDDKLAFLVQQLNQSRF